MMICKMLQRSVAALDTVFRGRHHTEKPELINSSGKIVF